jgi:hypothetical protein
VPGAIGDADRRDDGRSWTDANDKAHHRNLDRPEDGGGLMRLSDRSLPLVYQGPPLPTTTTIVTVENYVKWYGIHLVHPGGRIEEVPFPDDTPDIGSYFVDHVPNPDSVAKMARRLGYEVDPMSYEMMVGRWEIEVTGRVRGSDDDSPGVAL